MIDQYSDAELLYELIQRNNLSPAAVRTHRIGKGHQSAVVGIGWDETAEICIHDSGLKTLADLAGRDGRERAKKHENARPVETRFLREQVEDLREARDKSARAYEQQIRELEDQVRRANGQVREHKSQREATLRSYNTVVGKNQQLQRRLREKSEKIEELLGELASWKGGTAGLMDSLAKNRIGVLEKQLEDKTDELYRKTQELRLAQDELHGYMTEFDTAVETKLEAKKREYDALDAYAQKILQQNSVLREALIIDEGLKPYRSTALTFDDFSDLSVARSSAPDGFNKPLEEWSIPMWFMATLGELGEAANVAKKLVALEQGVPASGNLTREELEKKLGSEIADTYIYLDLLARKCGFRMSEIVERTFNATSEKFGMPYRSPEWFAMRERLIASIPGGDNAGS